MRGVPCGAIGVAASLAVFHAHLLRRPLLIGPALVLAAACSSDRTAPPAALSADVRISSENAVQVGSAVYCTALAPLRVARLFGGFFEVEPPEDGAPTGLLVRELEGPEGGSIVFTWDDRDGDGEYTSGDAFVFDCRQYRESGLEVTGAAAFEDVRLVGNVSDDLNWVLGATLRCVGLEVAVGSGSSVFDGVLRFDWENRFTVRVLTLRPVDRFRCSARTLLPGTVLVRSEWTSGVPRMDLVLDGATDDPVLGGVVTFATGPNLSGIRFLPDPSSGRLEVRGAGGSALRLLPMDFFNVTLEIDQDGDGEVDASSDAEWAAF